MKGSHFTLSFILLLFSFSIERCFAQDVEMVEFPLGHETGKIASPIDQLKSFPAPRYAQNHKLLRNYNWVSSIQNLGGMRYDTSLTQIEKVANAVEIQKELAFNWNYYFHLGNSGRVAKAKMNKVKTNPFAAFINAANENPEMPISVTTFWLQVNLQDVGEKGRKPFVHRKNLPDSIYIKNYKTPFGHPVFSFAASDSLLKIDGSAQRFYFDEISKKLTRPINIINENGEVRPFLPIHRAVLRDDERLKKDFKTSGIKDWRKYQATNKLRFRKAFKNSFFSTGHPLITNETLFTWYAIDGNRRARYDWSISRKISTPIYGNYYSTGDFYPRWPKNWKKGAGAWHGWNWVKRARQVEIKNGDNLFSPFIGAGWDHRPEKNIRPSQWLALLKHLNIVGAEFFYTGFFNINKPIPDPENYFWQVVIPSYAQAVASHYEGILRNGELLKNKNGNYIFEIPNNNNALITIRKHRDLPQYIIVGSLQPGAIIRAIPDKKNVRFSIENNEIEIEVRKQGSVYHLDFTDKENPILRQLDKWHEKGHPSRWSKEIVTEAENHDSAKNVNIITTVKSKNDFKEFYTTALLNDKESELNYNCFCKKDISYDLSFLASHKAKKSKGIVSIDNDTKNVKIESNKLELYTLENKKEMPTLICPDSGFIKIQFREFDEPVFIDKLTLTPVLN